MAVPVSLNLPGLTGGIPPLNTASTATSGANPTGFLELQGASFSASGAAPWVVTYGAPNSITGASGSSGVPSWLLIAAAIGAALWIARKK